MSLGRVPFQADDDLRSRLLRSRIVTLGPSLDGEGASEVIGQLLLLEASGRGRDVGLHINCGGGPLEAAFAVYDVMESISSDVCTLCTGQAAGTAAMLLAAGARGRRLAFAHARIVLRQPSSPPIEGPAGQVGVRAQEFLRERDRLVGILSRHCGRHPEQVEGELERDFPMTAGQAVAWGLIDGIAGK